MKICAELHVEEKCQNLILCSNCILFYNGMWKIGHVIDELFPIRYEKVHICVIGNHYDRSTLG